jgi:hypothetical protein
VFALCVADLPRLATSVWAPKFAVLLVMGAAGIPVLLLRAFGRRGQSSGTELRARGSRTERRARGSRTERRAARFAVAFVLAGVVSMAGAARPLLALVGLYEQGTGWLFVMALAGCWALGTYLRAPDRDLVATALIGGALVNAVVSILQQATDLSSVGLGGFPNGTAPALPDGLLGNPSYSGALLAAALALIAPRFLAQPRRWAVPAAVIGVGLGVGGERLPALVALAVCLVVVWIARTHTAASVPAGESDRVDLSSRMLRSVLFSVPSLGGVIVGSIVARTSGGVGVVSHAAQSTANETFGQRFHAWSAALHAIGHSVGSHLAFGYGPGQFRAATSAYFSVSFERSSGVTFTDAHNLFVEYLTTTGIVGVVLLVCWLGCTVIPARGPMPGSPRAVPARSTPGRCGERSRPRTN